MRLLYLTDTHIRSGNPRNRRDDFPATLRAKLLEVAGLVRKLGVFAVLHGGDFFDQPCPELPVVGEFVRIFRDMDVAVYVVPGNHDIFACNPDTLEHTVLGLLHQVGCLRVLQAGEKLYLKDGRVTVQLTGTPFHYNIDRQDPLLDYCVTKENCDFAIHLAHGMLLDRPFFPGTPYTLISQIAPFTEADYTLGSHAHFGYPDVEWEGRWFINPGSLVRLSAHPVDRERTPQVLLIDFSGSVPAHHKIPLQAARPGIEVLNTATTPLMVRRGKKQPPVGQNADNGDGGHDFSDILREVACREAFPAEVTREALRLLSCVRERDENEWDGRHLRRLVIENFQSHLYTDLEFAPGLNVILGESNQGKSAIVRALQWLLFNEPPANSFLRTGEAYSRVTGVFGNQRLVFREYVPSKMGAAPGVSSLGAAGTDAGNPFPDGEPARAAELPRVELDDDVHVCLHIASEQAEPFLLSYSDTVKARAIDRLSGALRFEAARQEAERLARLALENDARQPDPRFLKQVGTLLSQAAARSREEVCFRIQDIVNQALGSVFDPAPEFHILLDDQSVTPKAEFLMVLEPGSVNLYHAVQSACGGGVVDVISVALRVAFLELTQPPLGGPLILDEPVKQVSSRFASHVSRLFKTFSDSFGRQIIVVTHSQHLAGTADAVFILRFESGASVLYGRGSSIRASSKREKSLS